MINDTKVYTIGKIVRCKESRIYNTMTRVYLDNEAAAEVEAYEYLSTLKEAWNKLCHKVDGNLTLEHKPTKWNAKQLSTVILPLKLKLNA